MIVLIVAIARSILRMVVIVTMRLVTMRLVIMCLVTMGVGLVMGRVVMMPGIVGLRLASIDRLVAMGLVALVGLGRLGRILSGILDDVALDALAMAATARIAVTRTATVAVGGAVLALFLGLAMGALVGLDQRLTVGHRNLIVVRMDFAERQEAVAVAAIFDERRLQRRFYACDLGEINVAAELFAVCGFEIELFNAVAAQHDHPGFLRVRRIDEHFVGH